jgi:hypothetical protein
MSQASTADHPQIRVVRRQAVRPTISLSLRPVRPSLLDLRLAGDPWIVPQGENLLALCFSDWQLASLRGMGLDLPGLNQLLDRMRHRRPRPRRRR